jgi:hypothetical protein
MTTFSHLSELSDTALLQEADTLAARERESTAALIAALREIDARRLYLAEGYSCMFFYCTKRLHLSEHSAYNRIEVARASRGVPGILDALQAGALNLSTARLIAPHLTRANEKELIEACSFKSRREVERLVAERFGGAAEPAGYKIQFTADQDTYDKLCQAQALMRHQNPYGLIAPIVNKALTLLIADIERVRAGLVARPRKARRTAAGSRHIPAEVKRAVWIRDGAQCTFEGPAGRCGERGSLEFHHLHPFAEAGPSSVDNLELRCRAHNVHEAHVFAAASDA